MALVAGLSSLLFVPLDTDGDGAGGTKLRRPDLDPDAEGPGAPAEAVGVREREAGRHRGRRSGLGRPDGDRARRGCCSRARTACGCSSGRRPASPGGRRSAAAVRRVTLGPAQAPAPPGAGVAALGGDHAGRRGQAGGGAARAGAHLVLRAGPRRRPSWCCRTASSASGASGLVRVAGTGRPPRTLFEGPAGRRATPRPPGIWGRRRARRCASIWSGGAGPPPGRRPG